MPSIPSRFLALALAVSPLAVLSDPQSESTECVLVLCSDPAFEDRWQHTPADAGVTIPNTHSVVRKQYFSTNLFLTKFPIEKRVLQYDIRMTKPDGGVYFEQKDLDGFNIGKESKGSVLLSNAALTVCFEPEDALGSYTASVVVHDSDGKAFATAEKSIELVEYVEGDGFKYQEELSAWITGYRENQQPTRVIPAFLGVDKGSESAPFGAFLHGFFDEAFRCNTWLFPLLLGKYPSVDVDKQKRILRLLARSEYDARTFIANLQEADLDEWREIRAESRWNPREDPIATLEHASELWGMYAGSGRFAPIHRMCGALAVDEPTPGGSGNSEVADGQPASSRGLVRLATATELATAINQDKVVAQYCQWIVENDLTPEVVRVELSRFLDKK